MRFLIAGDRGYLGTALRRRLERDQHEVVGLTRGEPAPGQVQWDPGNASLDPSVLDGVDVVACVTGSPLLGIPHSPAYAKRLLESRVTPTRVLAEAIAASDRKPAFLAGNGSSWYGDRGDDLLTEREPSRGDALLTRVTREWQAATEPAAEAGARVCVLRTAPVFGPGSMVATTLRRVFLLGVGGRLGSGRQYFPLISSHDWVEAAVLLGTQDAISGPVNLVVPEVPTNAEFTVALGKALHRPAVLPVPSPVIRLAAGPMAPELLNSVRARPQALLDAGFGFRHPHVADVLAFTYGSA